MIWIALPIGIVVLGLWLLRKYRRPSQSSGRDGGTSTYDSWTSSSDVTTVSTDTPSIAGGDFGGSGATGDWGGDSGSDGGSDSGGGDSSSD